jgi:hypothetical protein
MKVTLWPMKQLSSIVTPSQIKVWLETCVTANLSPFLDFHKGSDLGAIPDLASIEIDEIVDLDSLAQFDIRCDLLHFPQNLQSLKSILISFIRLDDLPHQERTAASTLSESERQIQLTRSKFTPFFSAAPGSIEARPSREGYFRLPAAIVQKNHPAAANFQPHDRNLRKPIPPGTPDRHPERHDVT